MPYTPEELATLKELRLENKKRYQREYYLKKTKPKRKWITNKKSPNSHLIVKENYGTSTKT